MFVLGTKDDTHAATAQCKIIIQPFTATLSIASPPRYSLETHPPI